MAATAPVPAGHRLRAGSFRLPAAVSPGNGWGSCRKPRLPGPAHAERPHWIALTSLSRRRAQRAGLQRRLGALAMCTEALEHPEVATGEEMMPHIQHLKGAHSKNLFLKDKKKEGYWLVTVLYDRQINLNDLAKQLGVGSGNLRFVDETAMLEKLKVGQGCAIPLTRFCDDGDVKFVLDSAVLQGGYEKVYFHPMPSAATMGLSPEDFLIFVKKTGHDPIILHFDKNN
ncbi:prolyl-tRNA synthetase associated domain-containing protein 1 [Rhinolophus sinicus]|uniref:prolyl-tRNA synthetase associated domain-containing protein 1 n=1 Tax=Rhinolophus sinicus TaxID=89399 RepID=UPI003D7A21BF